MAHVILSEPPESEPLTSPHVSNIPDVWLFVILTGVKTSLEFNAQSKLLKVYLEEPEFLQRILKDLGNSIAFSSSELDRIASESGKAGKWILCCKEVVELLVGEVKPFCSFLSGLYGSTRISRLKGLWYHLRSLGSRIANSSAEMNILAVIAFSWRVELLQEMGALILLWKGTLSIKRSSSIGIGHVVRKGDKTFWLDIWRGEEPLVRRFPKYATFKDITTLQNFEEGGSWNLYLRRTSFKEREQALNGD
ncbi:hypothetical protein FRX31_004759 [Thalictrum thalictroides]|uniref:Uncharacterized protein n=1 Tax=Thalictrum thalictroides TaxID=46969 RepID=A0A7J6XA19_THATH|nr:hypothetical protein FRX31_004759 [Thalictrum thalictroides]